MQTVPLNGVVDCVVRNAYTKLLDKQQVPSHSRFEFFSWDAVGSSSVEGRFAGRFDLSSEITIRVLIDSVINRNFAP